MQKIKKYKASVAALLIFSLLAIYGSVPTAKAVSLDLAKDTISDSSPSATGVTHTILFDMGTALSEGQYVKITFDDLIDISNGTTTCPAGTSGSASGQYIQCTVNPSSSLASTSAQTISFVGAENPADVDDYTVTVSTHLSGGGEIESSEMKIYIVEQVTVTARVPATLTFTVATATAETVVNAEALTGTSTPTSISFGTLEPENEYVMGQTLSVSTNAADGFVVTVQQDGNLRNAAAADIDSYSVGSNSAWATPTPDIDDDSTWGYMGVTSNDPDYFGDDEFRGLSGVSPLEILTNDGPANSSGTGTGTAIVAYKIEISSLQEAGDYQNILTYICTPTF